MKKITQQNIILSIFENIVRSNIYLFIFSRYITNRFFSKIIYETDFNILYYLRGTNFFSKKSVLDIGANDGISVKIMRKFIKNKIISFEPNIENYNKIKKLKKKINDLSIYNIGLSNKVSNKVNIYEAHFKKYHLSPFDSLSKNNVIKHLKDSLFIKNIKKIISIKKTFVKINKLDNYKLSPCFIKIDIQGHEYECIKGSVNTIQKHKPIIMVEYDNLIILKVYKILNKFGYKKFYFISGKKKLIEHKKEKVFNIFFIHNSLINQLNKKIRIYKLDNYKT